MSVLCCSTGTVLLPNGLSFAGVGAFANPCTDLAPPCIMLPHPLDPACALLPPQPLKSLSLSPLICAAVKKPSPFHLAPLASLDRAGSWAGTVRVGYVVKLEGLAVFPPPGLQPPNRLDCPRSAAGRYDSMQWLGRLVADAAR